MQITKQIHTVRAVDSDIRYFHGYETPIGTTYNSYLIIDAQITLVDFVKAHFAQNLLDSIKEIIGDKPIDYIICNHVEPDHSGALPEVVQVYPNAVIYGTAACEKGLKAYYPDSAYTFKVVQNGDTLNTAHHTFHFLPMPMVHWPDSMSTYLEEEKILFSNDAFGQHIGTGEMFDTDLGLEKLLDRAGDYYANIVLPYGMQVQKVLEAASHLDIQSIYPAHGVIIKDFAPQMLEKYSDWAANKVKENKLTICYDTMWGTTRKIANTLSDEYSAKGFEVEMIDLAEKHCSYAMAHLLEAKYIFVGSPTLNNQMMPSVSAFLTYMKGLKPKNRVGLAFGSYGWSGESIPQINEILTSCGFEMKGPIKTMWNF